MDRAGFDYADVRLRAHNRFPSPETVVLCIQERDRQGLPLNKTGLMNTADPNRDHALYLAARKHFANWRAAIEAAGLDYQATKAIPSSRKYRDKKAVCAEICRRVEARLPVNSLAVAKGEQRDESLYGWGQRFFGSWRMAVEAAGFDYCDCVAPPARKYADSSAVLREIRRRYAVGLPVNSLRVAKGEQRDERLYRSGQLFFASWRAAVKLAGIDYDQHRRDLARKYPDRKAVVAQIKHRGREGFPLNGLAVAKGEHRDPALYYSAREYFGNWAAAIKAAGFPVGDICGKQPTRYPDPVSVVCEIKRRHAQGIALNHGALNKGEVQDQQLLRGAKKFHGGWGQAIGHAGLDYAAIRKK